jgi:hypothetical protein
MKIWFKIGVGQDRQQPRQLYSAVGANARFLRPRQSSGRPFLRARRAGVEDLSLALLNARSAAPATRKSPKIAFFSALCTPTSNRKWVKNRCYRKQTTKPSLTGARTHIRDSGFPSLFPINSSPANREPRPLNRSKISRPHAAERDVRVRHVYPRRMLLLPGETATNGLH